MSCNLSTVDGLINGAVCTMKHIDYTNGKNNNIPSTLWVQFEDEDIGKTITQMKLVIRGHQYLHNTEKQLHVIVEQSERHFH